MDDEGEIRADGEICYGDQVRRRQLQELQGLDEGHKLQTNPAVENHLSHHQAGHQMDHSAVLSGATSTKEKQNAYF